MYDIYNEDVITKYKKRFVGFIQDAWPSIYRAINDFFFGTIKFIKYILESVFNAFIKW